MENIVFSEILDYSSSLAGEVLAKLEMPWDILDTLTEYIRQLGKQLEKEGWREILPEVWVGENVTIAPTAEIHGPCIIGEGSEIRHCAFIRGSALIGKGCVVGNSTELKNCILFDKTQVPHYNYVGDSILGYRSHMGAGSITSNVKSDKTNVVIKDGSDFIETGIKKIGAMLGDHVEVGCNSVLNPGTIVGRNSSIYPTSCVRGVIPPNSIFKAAGSVVPKK